jgi:hypothetical protein
MRQARAWFVRMLRLFGKNRRDHELAEELEFHLQLHVEDGIRSSDAAGLSHARKPQSKQTIQKFRMGEILPQKGDPKDIKTASLSGKGRQFLQPQSAGINGHP